jgi:hypothetical protein|tara:strand:- start:44 stop:190 length:147 start_codon:yes stop_codon:yes gene_type:complete
VSKTLKQIADKVERRFKPKPKNRHHARWAIEDIKLAKEFRIDIDELKR